MMIIKSEYRVEHMNKVSSMLSQGYTVRRHWPSDGVAPHETHFNDKPRK